MGRSCRKGIHVQRTNILLDQQGYVAIKCRYINLYTKQYERRLFISTMQKYGIEDKAVIQNAYQDILHNMTQERQIAKSASPIWKNDW